MNSADPGLISPGLIGFLATFGVVVVSVLLFLSMTRHLRKVSYRAQHLPEEPPGQRLEDRAEEDWADGRVEELGDERSDEDGDAPRSEPSGR